MIPIPLTIVFMLADRLPAHVLWMGWGGVGVGWGNNVRCNCFVTDLLRHFVAVASSRSCYATSTYIAFASSRSCYATSTYVAIASSRSCYATWGNNVRCKVMISWKPTRVICSEASLYFAVLWNLRTRQ